ncbi:MAG TPA: hypothetical protein VH761_08620 [Ilumatobacteraceae bacterium]
MALEFDQRPYLDGGWLLWSVKNTGQLAVQTGTSIGEWEMWDASDITRTAIPSTQVPAKEEILPNGVEWAQVWVQMAPQPGFSGQGKIVVQVGTDIAEVAYDWMELSADEPVESPLGGAGSLMFDQRPAQSSGALQWSVCNAGDLVIRAGTPIGEWEIMDTDNITSTIVPKQIVYSTEDLLPNDVAWTPRIELAPLTPVPGWYTIVVQLGTDIASVDYLIADQQVVE